MIKKVAAILLLTTVAASADGLRVVEIEQEVSEFLNGVTLTGRVVNEGQQRESGIYVTVTLKLEGRVVAVKFGSIDSARDGDLFPGDTGIFSLSTSMTPSEFDDFSFSFFSFSSQVDPDHVEGTVALIDESVSLVENFSGDAVLLGEFVNSTNAVLDDLTAVVIFYDSNGAFLGSARDSGILVYPDEVSPGMILPISASSDVPLVDVATWEIQFEYTAVRIVDLIPTAVEELSWAQVKGLPSFP
jgi:hypothetical protein